MDDYGEDEQVFIISRDEELCTKCLDCEEHLDKLLSVTLNRRLFVSVTNYYANLMAINQAITQCPTKALSLEEN